MTFRLILVTQYRENYGAHAWDGTGACPQHWKNKGGSEYIAATLTTEEAAKGQTYLQATYVDPARPLVEKDNEYDQEWIIDWELLGPGELTHDEKLQLEFDGRIVEPPTDLTRDLARQAA